MDLTVITLEKLLDNRLIKHIEKDGEFYFSKDSMNVFFEDNFKYTPHVTLTWKGTSNFVESGNFISYKEISEQVDYIKDKPSFGENIDKMFGFNNKK
jgi:hypothetical protein